MKNHTKKEPLYRKVNTCTRNVRHDFGGEYRYDRNTKGVINSEDNRASMHGKVNRGLDYNPLFKFLLSKVGQDWTAVHKEAVSRLDRPDPIFWMVALNEEDRQDIVRIGENRYFNGLYVDQNNILQKVAPHANGTQINLWCACCTTTFNGVVLHNKVKDVNSFTG
jgi:hypothetical protein